LAICYLNGIGTKHDPSVAIKLFKKAARLGQKDSSLVLAELHKNGAFVKKSDSKAHKILVKSAEFKHTDSEYIVGLNFLNGSGVKRDLKKAKEYLVRASEKDHQDAIFQLGVLHELGDENDKQKAKEYYEIGAKNSHPASLNNLGMCKKDEGDDKEAVSLWLRAAEKGELNAIYNLGLACLFGEGIEQNVIAAINYFMIAADNEYPLAFESLGDIYSQCEFTEPNVPLAIHYYELSLYHGNKLVLPKLESLYHFSIGD
jgi:TPR repeat protein